MNRIRRKRIAEINVVPYIDVMLVLLVIFMVTAPLLSQGVEVSLPKVGSEPYPPGEHEPVVVSIDASSKYYINYGENKDKPVALEVLVTRVAALLKYRPETKFFVRSDENVPYGRVVKLMAKLQLSGVQSPIGLMTDPLEQQL